MVKKLGYDNVDVLGYLLRELHHPEQASLGDVPTVLIAEATVVVLIVSKKVPEPILIFLAGAVGFLLHNG